MNESKTPAAKVFLLAVGPIGTLADRANLVLSLPAVFSPLVLLALDLPWELVLLLVLAVGLALVFWAAVRLQRPCGDRVRTRSRRTPRVNCGGSCFMNRIQ